MKKIFFIFIIISLILSTSSKALAPNIYFVKIPFLKTKKENTVSGWRVYSFLDLKDSNS